MIVLKKHLYLTITIILILLIIGWVTLVLKGEYGTTLFFSIPATIGFLVGYANKYKSTNDKTLHKGARGCAVTMLVIASLSGLLIAIGVEGAICILMAFPFLVLPIFFAYIIGLYIGKKDRDNKINSTALMILLLLNPTSYIFDSYSKPIQNTVSSTLIINKNKASIWNKLTNCIEFKNKPNLLFEEGVSYPKSIKLIKDKKPYYLCFTNNDTIKLSINSMKNKKMVRFTPQTQTIPMREISPYDTIHAEHLNNYFKVNYGSIKLDSVTPNKTKITATTSYSYKIAPNWYWKMWSNYIIDEMQLHVLNSLK